MFTGDETQHAIQVSRWSADYVPEDPFSTIIVPSEDGDWNFFSSGAAYDPPLHMWFVAYNNVAFGQDPGAVAAVSLAAFTEDLDLLWTRSVSGPGMSRPHLALAGDTLFVAFDGEGVYVQRYAITVPGQDARSWRSERSRDVDPSPAVARTRTPARALSPR